MATIHAWSVLNDSDPGADIIPISPSDTLDISSTAENGDTVIGVRALRANTAGVIVAIMASGQTRTLNFLAGETRVGFFQRVKATSTTCTGIEGHI